MGFDFRFIRTCIPTLQGKSTITTFKVVKVAMVGLVFMPRSFALLLLCFSLYTHNKTWEKDFFFTPFPLPPPTMKTNLTKKYNK